MGPSEGAIVGKVVGILLGSFVGELEGVLLGAHGAIRRTGWRPGLASKAQYLNTWVPDSATIAKEISDAKMFMLMYEVISKSTKSPATLGRQWKRVDHLHKLYLHQDYSM